VWQLTIAVMSYVIVHDHLKLSLLKMWKRCGLSDIKKRNAIAKHSRTNADQMHCTVLKPASLLFKCQAEVMKTHNILVLFIQRHYLLYVLFHTQLNYSFLGILLNMFKPLCGFFLPFTLQNQQHTLHITARHSK
jgi:hypothetical protein